MYCGPTLQEPMIENGIILWVESNPLNLVGLNVSYPSQTRTLILYQIKV